MLDSLSLIHVLAFSPPSPPGWQAYVSLLEDILDFLANIFHSGGLAVIAFTIGVKTLLLPLTITSIRSSKAMQELQPKIKEIQKKYGKDRAKVSQETMKLYQTHRVNPMAGCLPMIIQIPIFFGVYRAIRALSMSDAGYWHGGFLWLPSLAQADPYHILPILAGVFQFVQTKMMRPAGQGKVQDPQQAMMNQMMNFMPITVVLFGWGYDSGPVLYWVTQSLYSVVQQWFITGWGSMKDWMPGLPELPEHRRLGYRPPRDLDDVVVMSGEEAPRQRGIMGWFNAKMQEAQQQQAERAARAKGQSGSELQRKVDAETERAGPKPPRPVKKEVRTARQRDGTATANGAASTAPAQANASNKPSGNGKVSRNGASGPPIVPRKSRPTRKDDTPTE
ncbi:MAG TPA: YidC/Oxa1 family membrane protein insertase [Thermomicrobiales bacterium]